MAGGSFSLDPTEGTCTAFPQITAGFGGEEKGMKRGREDGEECPM